MPTKFSPSVLPIPNKTAAVAPKEAPEEIPRIYGSANGFFTIACITTPQTDKPAPTQIAKTILGIRKSQIISYNAPFLSLDLIP